MAPSVNKVILLGNLGRDAELTFTPSGQALSKVGLATSRRWQDKGSGEWQEETEWHNLVIWGKTAEKLYAPTLTKGQSRLRRRTHQVAHLGKRRREALRHRHRGRRNCTRRQPRRL